MCGIVGIIDARGGIDQAVVVRMRDTLTHRGPDDAGVWIGPGGRAAMGHRRLSILDLSPLGHQPMSDPGGRVWLVFNGEIYNFQALRDELRGGYNFISDSDTEVIVAAYLAWGIECVQRFEGMFAIALHDTREKVTYLIRDRLGIKPVFYSTAGGRLVFGSEIRAVLASATVPADLSAEAAYDYFSYGYVPTPATIYESILKLPPASILRYACNEPPQVRRYWQAAFECLGDSEPAAAQRLRGLVDQAVEAYLVADVPTGAYLSGGLDSSIIVQQAARAFADRTGRRLGGGGLHTFTIGFDVAEHSELHYARDAAAMYGTDHAEQVVTREMAHAMDQEIIDLFDEPFAASSTIPMTFVAELARRKVTVALCGEGGDESFGGYSWYTWWMKFQRPSFWRSGAGQVARRVLETIIRRPKRKWRLPALGGVELFAQLMGAMSGSDKRRVFSADVAARMGDRDDAAYFRQYWRNDLPPMARMQHVDLMTFLPDLNLTRADRTSMRVSLELRVPLLNHHLVEYCCGLRQDVRNPGCELKGLYKQAMLPRLPESIRTRKKKGFSAPVKQWFSSQDISRLVADVRAEHGDLARSWLNADLERYASRLEGSRAYKLWVFLKWLRKNAK